MESNSVLIEQQKRVLSLVEGGIERDELLLETVLEGKKKKAKIAGAEQIRVAAPPSAPAPSAGPRLVLGAAKATGKSGVKHSKPAARK